MLYDEKGPNYAILHIYRRRYCNVTEEKINEWIIREDDAKAIGTARMIGFILVPKRKKCSYFLFLELAEPYIQTGNDSHIVLQFPTINRLIA